MEAGFHLRDRKQTGPAEGVRRSGGRTGATTGAFGYRSLNTLARARRCPTWAATEYEGA